MPDDTNWAELKEELAQRLSRSGFMAYLGVVVEDVSPGACLVSLTRRPELLQNLGYMHGGVIGFLVDNSASIAAATMMRPGQAVVTAEFKVNFLAPARGDRVFARAKVLKAGRTMTIASADVFSVEDGQDRHVATGLATIAIVAMPGGK